MKAVKWIGIVVGGLIVLVIAALVLIPLFVNVQKYKPEIEKQVAAATGRPFAIKGDLKLSLFPWAGVAFSDLSLGSPPGYNEKDMLFIKSFDVRMKLLPLLSKDIQVQRFVVEGPRLALEKDKNGRGNWEGLGKPSEKSAPKAAAPSAPKPSAEGLPLKSLAVGEFAVRNGSILYVDDGSGARQEVSNLTLELKNVSLDRPIRLVFSALLDKMPVSLEGQVGPLGKEPGKGNVPVDLSIKAFKEVQMNLKGSLQNLTASPQFDLTLQMDPFSPRKIFAALGKPFPVATADQEALNRVGLKSRIQGSPQNVNLSQGVLDLDDSKLNFSATAKDFSKPDLTFDLNLDKINLDRYMPPPPEKGGGVEAKKEKPAQPGKTDYTPLRKMVLDGKARIGMLTSKGVKIEDIELKVKGRNGVIQLDPLLAKLYKGSLSAKAAVDVRQDVPRSSMDFQTKGVQAGPLLQDMMKKDFLEGTGNAEASITMTGDQSEQIKKTLNGKGQLLFTDGSINGIDLAGMVRNVTSAFGSSQAGAAKPHTDFSEFKAPFTITNGVVNTTDTTLASPLMRVQAAGKANLVDESLDFRVEPKFVGTLVGQGDTQTRSGITVPLLVTGTFSSPSFRPDLKGMLQERLKQSLPSPQEILKGQGGQQKSVQDTLKGLFKGLPGKP